MFALKRVMRTNLDIDVYITGYLLFLNKHTTEMHDI
jgi:hypothetical protein